MIIENFNEFFLREDKGSLVENTVFLQLFKNKFTSVRYWRTIHGAEVDFVIKIGEDLIPIEVKYTNFTSPKLGRSFINFVKKYKPPCGLVLTKGFWGEAKIGKTDVLFAPVWFIWLCLLIEEYYIQNWYIGMDIKILLKTIPAVFIW